MKIRWYRSLVSLVLTAALSSCSTVNDTPVASLDDALFAGSIDSLAPFRHGNTYRYIVRTDGEKNRVIESRCSIAGSRIFVTVTEGLNVIARTEMVIEDDSIQLVSEISPQHDIAFNYDPPLSVLTAPLHTGLHREQSHMRAWRPSDGSTISEGTVHLTWSAHRAPLEMRDTSFEIRSVKRLELANGRTVKIQSKRWLSPGIGEISSTGTVGDGRVEYRELACAEVAGRRYGDCGAPIVRSDE